MANENSQFDPSQTQWYNATPEPEETKKPNLKKWGIIAVSAFGGLIVIVLIVFLVRNLLEPTLTAKKVVEQTVTTAEAQCQDARDVAKCLAGVPSNLAQATGDGVYCKGLVNEDRDSCLGLAALTSKDAKICDEISDQAKKTSCQDAMIALSMTSSSGFGVCAGFNDVKTRTECEAGWKLKAMMKGSCESPLTAEECTNGGYLKSAIDTRNPVLCNQLTNADLVLTCRELVGSGDIDLDGISADEEKFRGTSDTNSDSDADGLSDFEEINTYKTDPAAPDTDRDGYNDGAEVKAGYDPLN